jgi:quercetin dioxygenase-like cupin family protein
MHLLSMLQATGLSWRKIGMANSGDGQLKDEAAHEKPEPCLQLVKAGCLMEARAAASYRCRQPVAKELAMALHHVSSGELIDLHPLGSQLAASTSTALLKTSQLELMRLVLPAGKSVPEHQVPGEMTIQCLEGTVELAAHGRTQQLQAGQMVYLAGGVPHALTALADCSLLAMILLVQDS